MKKILLIIFILFTHFIIHAENNEIILQGINKSTLEKYSLQVNNNQIVIGTLVPLELKKTLTESMEHDMDDGIYNSTTATSCDIGDVDFFRNSDLVLGFLHNTNFLIAIQLRSNKYCNWGGLKVGDKWEPEFVRKYRYQITKSKQENKEIISIWMIDELKATNKYELEQYIDINQETKQILFITMMIRTVYP